MKKLTLLGIIFTIVFVFSLALTVELFAFEDPSDPIPGVPARCCTYTTWCGTVGHGSKIGSECWCWLPPSSPWYNPDCNYQCAANCPAE